MTARHRRLAGAPGAFLIKRGEEIDASADHA
jgi:hypothetical protein